MDLFDIAQRNAIRLDELFARLMETPPSSSKDNLVAFAEVVRCHGRIAVNMRPWNVVDLVQNNRHLNIYEAADEVATLAGKPRDEILRNRLGDWYVRRTGFDHCFPDGPCFRYGGLNIGGLGATDYGTFCVVLQPGFPADGRVAYLKTDSLRGYTDASGTVNVAALQGDIAPQASCHILATLKHVPEIEGHGKEEWPSVLCSSNEYVEVIFVACLRCDVVEEVRASRHELAIAEHLCFDAHGRKLKDEEKALASIYLSLFRARHEGRILLREVAND
jgi:hypothetical protein